MFASHLWGLIAATAYSPLELGYACRQSEPKDVSKARELRRRGNA